MTITRQPAESSSSIGGSVDVTPHACTHLPTRTVAPWVGEPGTAGTVVVVGAGKMGLPLAAQYASHGWKVTAVDVNPVVVEAINGGRTHIAEEPGLAELVAQAHGAGRLRATLDAAEAARGADLIVMIVPVALDADARPDRHAMDAAVKAIAPGISPGTTVIFETTLPVGDTRQRYAPRLARATGLTHEEDVFVAFSPERLYSGSAFRNLAAYPKLVGGIGEASTNRAASFYGSVLDVEVVVMSSAEAAEMAKLAETVYRDVNIAFANELARFASRASVDVLEVIRAANSQPYSHIHEPGLGVGGHCIPVYPHFLLTEAPDLALVRLARAINDGQVLHATRELADALGPLGGLPVLVLGLTYRAGVRELAYSRGPALVDALRAVGAVVSAWDPLLEPEHIRGLGAEPWLRGETSDARAIVVQTADPVFRSFEPAWFPSLDVILDGRNSLDPTSWPARVKLIGFGVPARQGSAPP